MCKKDRHLFELLVVLGAAVAVIGFAIARGPQNPAPAASKNSGMLTRSYNLGFLVKNMQSTAAWKPFPPAADRAAWEGLLAQPLNQQRKVWLVRSAEALLAKSWPALPASLYMEFARNGNRSRYERLYFARRENLATLVLAECFEHRGRFLDEIANGLWAISEEATWCVPAHAARLPKDVLHRQDLESVDLFAAETAMTLATTRYLLRSELEQLSPALADRLRREVLRRVVEPVESGDKFGRSVWLDGHNNWSPWCASNVMGAAMLLLEDPQRLAALTYRMMEVADRFVDRYGDDGGCDEGPGYWSEAGGALLVFLELLHSRSGGAIDIYRQPKIAAMGEFIVHAHIAGPWFVNFSDADARTLPPPGKVYRYGEQVNSGAMKELALLAMRGWRADAPVDPPLRLSGVSRAVLGPLMEIFWVPADARPGPGSLPAAVWMPDIQMLVARESAASPYSGLFLTVRGGHNAESHNHNDVGNLVVYLDGQPAIIDIGRETYTAKTFSKERYDLWFTRGSAHNAPVINGVEQKEGLQYRATQVEYRDQGQGQRLAMNLEQAYPAEAGIESLRREVDYLRHPGAAIRLRDAWKLAPGPAKLRYTFYAAQQVEQLEPGRLAVDTKPRKLLLEYAPGDLQLRLETVPLEDGSLRGNWGERLYRIVFEVAGNASEGGCEIRFRPLE